LARGRRAPILARRFPHRIKESDMLIGILSAAAILILAGLLLFRPPAVASLGGRIRPARDYAEAERRIAALRERDDGRVLPEARLQFFTHGAQTDKAIVFVHGYTNCPKQFVELGRRFFRLGYNVLIANLPRHGNPDRMTADQSNLTAEELAAYGDETADIAVGLGRRVTFAGLSCGGVVSAWAWAFRPGVGTAVLMAPAIGLRLLPSRLTVPAINLFSRLPAVYGWFNPVGKAGGTPPCTYPRWSTRALAQILRLGYAVRRRASESLPTGKKLILVTNPNDWAVDNQLMKETALEWKARGADVTLHEFSPALKLDHDFIDPAHPNQPVGVIYPMLEKWITEA
jgi:pimeloyl-ACP methyl ester carboxylesterase